MLRYKQGKKIFFKFNFSCKFGKDKIASFNEIMAYSQSNCCAYDVTEKKLFREFVLRRE